MKAQISVITGDLVNSRRVDTPRYLAQLHTELTALQQANQLTQFEIFRGDAFQAVGRPEHGLWLAVYLRCALKAHHADALWDARIAVGLGKRRGRGDGYGSAFLNSGNALDQMTKNCRLALKIDNERANAIVSDLLPMLDHNLSRLSQAEAQVVQARMLAATNAQAAAAVRKAASTVSATLKRAAYDEIIRFIDAINRII
ncbi:hypothetical protein [Serratia rubidaea]|nr:hypothetical protein [Serratia rubidaea]MBD8452490.1 hypothetical protein [Serratia rubidaea]MBS0975139.1 hypothetical protein [Serratia rubidaea]MDK1702539.1 hypothetical protein [Serratia rubidaea]WBF47042.1 hypothetical protein OLD77_08355 [Serratia rubidaea]HDJ1441073.1 hypothetical protein [Serratia rubidaea]